jgi:lipoprotein-anchoring transpeptidase ErfK/SrfK
VIHTVEPGETLTKIARHYDVNWRMLARINGMTPDGLLRAGQQLKVLPSKTRIVAWKSGFRLALFIDDYYVKEYPIGIGKEGRTPVGEFTVDSMLVEPRWYSPEGKVIEYGEEGHLLGDRWIGFADEPGAAGLGIHGTTEDSSIGTKCSNGCIRMTNQDVTELYDFVQMETRVQIRE